MRRVKSSSALRGRVLAGDLLCSADGVECRGLSAREAFDMIAGSQLDAGRTFVFLRERGGDVESF